MEAGATMLAFVLDQSGCWDTDFDREQALHPWLEVASLHGAEVVLGKPGPFLICLMRVSALRELGPAARYLGYLSLSSTGILSFMVNFSC